MSELTTTIRATPIGSIAHTDAEIMAERRERFERKAAEEGTGEYIGFVGCAKRGGVQKVKVHSKARLVMEVVCPCGETHTTTSPMVRERLQGETVELVEVALPAVEPAAAAPKRRALGDAEILAAMPADWTLAADLAETLEYSSAKALRNRLRDMRKRAEKKGVPAPFGHEMRGGQRGRLYVRALS